METLNLYNVEKELTDLHTFDQMYKPLLISPAKEGTRITTHFGDVWVSQKPKDVYAYFGLKAPQEGLGSILMRWMGITLILRLYFEWRGRRAFKDPELQRLIKGQTPAKRRNWFGQKI